MDCCECPRAAEAANRKNISLMLAIAACASMAIGGCNPHAAGNSAPPAGAQGPQGRAKEPAPKPPAQPSMPASERAEEGLQRFRNGDLRGAIESAQAWVASDPSSALARNNLGYYLFELGDLEAARAELERALKLDPNLEIAKNNLAMIQRTPSPTPSSQSSTANALLTRGMELYQQGKLKEAIEATRQSTTLAPTSALAANNLGYFLFLAGEVDEAAAELRRALSLDPSLELARNNLAVAENATSKRRR
jgi:Flp pilus assembly protein TadD